MICVSCNKDKKRIRQGLCDRCRENALGQISGALERGQACRQCGRTPGHKLHEGLCRACYEEALRARPSLKLRIVFWGILAAAVIWSGFAVYGIVTFIR